MQTFGMSKLSEHLRQAGVLQSAFAEVLGVSRGHLSALISGARLPSLDLAVRIERETAGAVPAASWVPEPDPPAVAEGASLAPGLRTLPAVQMAPALSQNSLTDTRHPDGAEGRLP